MKLALVGYGNVGRAFARLLDEKRAACPARIVAIHTARHGTAYGEAGLPLEPEFGPPAKDIGEFLQRSGAGALVELSTLNPLTGEPAISHIRAAFDRGMHVVTANKGPLAHAYSDLREHAGRARVQFRYEPTVMDGTPVFNLVRQCLPEVGVTGFEGALNSTSSVVIEAMRKGLSREDGIAEARRRGVAEADVSYDLEGWDSAAKTAVLANVLLDAGVTPLQVERKGIGGLTPEKLAALKEKGKTVRLISRARRTPNGIKMRVRAEVIGEREFFGTLSDTTNALLLHTELMGTVGTYSVSPGVQQTAYGVLSDVYAIVHQYAAP